MPQPGPSGFLMGLDDGSTPSHRLGHEAHQPRRDWCSAYVPGDRSRPALRSRRSRSPRSRGRSSRPHPMKIQLSRLSPFWIGEPVDKVVQGRKKEPTQNQTGERRSTPSLPDWFDQPTQTAVAGSPEDRHHDQTPPLNGRGSTTSATPDAIDPALTGGCRWQIAATSPQPRSTRVSVSPALEQNQRTIARVGRRARKPCRQRSHTEHRESWVRRSLPSMSGQ